MAGLLLAALLLGPIAHRTLDVMRGEAVRGLWNGPGRGGGPAVALDAATAELVGVPLEPGHRFEILTEGSATYPRLWDDLRAARRSITLQSYYCNPGAVADSFAAVLTARARAGVEVLVLLDGFGCRAFEGADLERMRGAGVEVRVFRPVRWFTPHRAHHRSHVRVVVVDGQVGYTGGFGIDDKWYRPDAPGQEWREVNVRLTGPAVAGLQAAFAAGWAETTGRILVGEPFLPAGAAAAAGATGGAVLSTPGIGVTLAERLLALSVGGSRRTFFVTSPYFLPGADFRRLLMEAAARGVDVRVLTAGAATDVAATWYAGRAHYEALLSAGVRIYEYGPAMMHAKALVVDGEWGVLGTLNLDNRSLRLNDEVAVVVADAGVGAVLDSVFLAETARAEEVRLPAFRERPWHERLLERGASLLWLVL